MPAKKKGNKKKGAKKPQQQQSRSIPVTEQNAGPLLFSEPIVDPNADPVSDAEKKLRADKFKTLGNEAFKAKEYKKAVKHFSDAISWDTTNHVYFSNRSAAQIYCGKFKSALRDALKCVQLQPAWAKGYSRLGTAQFYLQNYMAAIGALKKGLTLEPDNEGMKTMLAKSEGLYVEQQAREAEKKAEDAANEGNAGEVVIGIDLGTTNSCVAIWRNETIEIIPNSEGRRTTPSIIGFLPDGQRIVGDAAKSQAASNPTNTIYDVKRLIGRVIKDHDVVKDVERLSYKVVGGGEDGEKPTISVEYQDETHEFAAEELSAMVLRKMKQTAEAYLNTTVTKAVITVPAYFNDAQRNATKTAGAIAGLDVLRIINEPTAAALAYGLDRSNASGKSAASSKETQNVLVFDLGGGTFDVSILSIEGGIFSVLSTGGDTHLGGEDFDDVIVDHFMEVIKRKFKPAQYEEIKASKRAMRRLRTAGEEAKRMLSASLSASVEVEDLVTGTDFTYTFSRALFEKLNAKFFARTMETVDAVLADAGIADSDIHDIVLVGGSTRIPKIQALLSERFGGKDLCKAINPDEAVAYGAAVQAAVLSGARDATTSSLLLVDVTPLSLGIETEGRVMSTLIKRNTPIPTSHKKTYTTVHDYQESVDIPIYEGERSCVDGNNLLGEFTISGIERAKKGVPKIVVSFDIDSNGILSVTARDDVTGSENSVQIKNRGRLAPEEIERMVEEAQKFEKEDSARLEVLEAKSELENLIYAASEAATTGKASSQLTQALNEVQNWSEMVDSPSMREINAQRQKLERFMVTA